MTRFIWPKSSPKRVAQSLDGHSALGIVAAALAYILSISGVLSVFSHELQRWEQPNIPEVSQVSPEALQRGAELVMSSETKETHHYFVQLPTPDLPRVVATTDNRAVFLDRHGNIAGTENHPWTQSILDLHYYLHLPTTLGLTIVGMTGVLILSITIAGFMAHPRIFRDAFTWRADGATRLKKADLHNRLSVWSSPFIISSALTGAGLGLASVIAYGIATLDYEGDIGAAYEPVFGYDPPANEQPAALPNIAAALSFMKTEKVGVDPTYIILHEPMTEGQHLQILAEHPKRLIFGDYYNFSADGQFIENVGMSDGTAGQQVVASMYLLHFGSYGGLPIKVAYAFFGIVLAAIVCAGMEIYFLRRRDKNRPAPIGEAMWSGVVWGTPAAIALTLFLSTAGLVQADLLPLFFWSTLVMITITATLAADRTFITGLVRPAAGLLTLLAMLVHWLTHQQAFHSAAAIPVTLCGIAIGLSLMGPELRTALNALYRGSSSNPQVPPA